MVYPRLADVAPESALQGYLEEGRRILVDAQPDATDGLGGSRGGFGSR